MPPGFSPMHALRLTGLASTLLACAYGAGPQPIEFKFVGIDRAEITAAGVKTGDLAYIV